KTLLGAQLRPGPGDRGQEVAGLLRQGFVVVEPGAARRRDGRSDDRAKQVAAAAHDDIVVRRVHREIAGAPAAQVPLRGLDRRATRPEAEHRRQTAGVAYAAAADRDLVIDVDVHVRPAAVDGERGPAAQRDGAEM